MNNIHTIALNKKRLCLVIIIAAVTLMIAVIGGCGVGVVDDYINPASDIIYITSDADDNELCETIPLENMASPPERIEPQPPVIINEPNKWDREFDPLIDGPIDGADTIVFWFVNGLIQGDLEIEASWWSNRQRSLTEELSNSLAPERLAEIRKEVFAAVGDLPGRHIDGSNWRVDITLITPVDNPPEYFIYSAKFRHTRGYSFFRIYGDRESGRFTDFSFEFEAAEIAPVSQELRNPFSIPLLEYLLGCVAIPKVGFDVPTKAFWVDADGNGTQSVLAIRHIREDDWAFPVGRIFYLYNDELFYKDVGVQDVGFVTSITVEGNRAVNVMGDGGSFSFTLFGMENGRLAKSFVIFGETIDGENRAYYYAQYLDGVLDWDNRQSITQEEFDEISARYSLNNLRGPWWVMEDEARQILSWTPSR